MQVTFFIVLFFPSIPQGVDGFFCRIFRNFFSVKYSELEEKTKNNCENILHV
nr:MAG TPA: hypothetical protein [Caudoviricetes sp.]